MITMPSAILRGDANDDIEALAKSVGVLRPRLLSVLATCACGCGQPVPDNQVMTSGCATR